jgi:lipoprotein-releasing system permease protein
MFELSVARKYLTPRWRQLSVSIISLISILVIALVVWLIVVFFSVTNGLEKGWVEKLITLTAPVRITPTDAYFDSYYYQVDSISANSDYTPKSIGEKLKSDFSDPYDESIDEEPSKHFAKPVLNADGSLKDLVKELYAQIENISSSSNLKEKITLQDYEATTSQIRIRLLRNHSSNMTESTISQATYLGSFDPANQSVEKTILPFSMDDLNNMFQMLSNSSTGLTEKEEFQKRLQHFFKAATIEKLKTPISSWNIPKSIWPKEASLRALKITRQNGKQEILITQDDKTSKELTHLYIQDGAKVESEIIRIQNGKIFINDLQASFPLKIVGSLEFLAKLDSESTKMAKKISDLNFFASFNLQDVLFEGLIPYQGLNIAKANIQKGLHPIEADLEKGDGIYLPKTFKDAGVLIGDLSYLSYYTPTMSSVQEQKTPTFIAGFYDPGLIPLGGKFILAPAELVSLIRVSQEQEPSANTNGINVRFDNLESADEVKHNIQAALKTAGLSPYFKVETYKEFDFTKDILQQLQSDKTLFTLISTIIIIVACSNIISMLIIMVNDKKVEIGILRSMGTSSFSIAAIFGICGIVMGTLGSAIGVGVAYVTLKNMKILIHFLSELQGHNAFNPMFYGETLPSEISFEAMLFVIASTACISLIAGIVPAVKASMLRPSAILRSE